MSLSRNALCAAILAACSVPAVGHAAASNTILPGYWESTEQYSVLLSGQNHDRKCLTKAQIDDFLNAPHTKHYQCNYSSQQVADGHAAFHGGACFSHTGRKVLSDVQVAGDYAPERFRLGFRFNLLVSAGVGLPGSGSIDAHRISAECPVDAKPDAPKTDPGSGSGK
jgi:hypothetical protein